MTFMTPNANLCLQKYVYQKFKLFLLHWCPFFLTEPNESPKVEERERKTRSKIAKIAKNQKKYMYVVVYLGQICKFFCKKLIIFDQNKFNLSENYYLK